MSEPEIAARAFAAFSSARFIGSKNEDNNLSSSAAVELLSDLAQKRCGSPFHCIEHSEHSARAGRRAGRERGLSQATMSAAVGSTLQHNMVLARLKCGLTQPAEAVAAMERLSSSTDCSFANSNSNNRNNRVNSNNVNNSNNSNNSNDEKEDKAEHARVVAPGSGVGVDIDSRFVSMYNRAVLHLHLRQLNNGLALLLRIISYAQEDFNSLLQQQGQQQGQQQRYHASDVASPTEAATTTTVQTRMRSAQAHPVDGVVANSKMGAYTSGDEANYHDVAAVGTSDLPVKQQRPAVPLWVLQHAAFVAVDLYLQFGMCDPASAIVRFLEQRFAATLSTPLTCAGDSTGGSTAALSSESSRSYPQASVTAAVPTTEVAASANMMSAHDLSFRLLLAKTAIQLQVRTSVKQMKRHVALAEAGGIAGAATPQPQRQQQSQVRSETGLCRSRARLRRAFTCLHMRTQLEYAKWNFVRAAEMLVGAVAMNQHDSTVALDIGTRIGSDHELVDAAIFFNNLGCVHYRQRKYHLASFYFDKALEHSRISSVRQTDSVAMSIADCSIAYNSAYAHMLCGRQAHAFERLQRLAYDPLGSQDARVWVRLAECVLAAGTKRSAVGRSATILLASGQSTSAHPVSVVAGTVRFDDVCRSSTLASASDSTSISALEDLTFGRASALNALELVHSSQLMGKQLDFSHLEHGLENLPQLGFLFTTTLSPESLERLELQALVLAASLAREACDYAQAHDFAQAVVAFVFSKDKNRCEDDVPHLGLARSQGVVAVSILAESLCMLGKPQEAVSALDVLPSDIILHSAGKAEDSRIREPATSLTVPDTIEETSRWPHSQSVVSANIQESSHAADVATTGIASEAQARTALAVNSAVAHLVLAGTPGATYEQSNAALSRSQEILSVCAPRQQGAVLHTLRLRAILALHQGNQFAVHRILHASGKSDAGPPPLVVP